MYRSVFAGSMPWYALQTSRTTLREPLALRFFPIEPLLSTRSSQRSTRPLAPSEALQENDQAIGRLVSDSLGVKDFQSTIDETIAKNDFNTAAVEEKHGESIEAIYDGLSKHFQKVNDEQDARVTEALRGLPSGHHDYGFEPIMEAFVAFPFLDLIAYPVLAAADIHELIDIDVMRISPRDVRRNAHPPLKSLGLEAFQGFLDREAREHDMMWGRRDGAERLLKSRHGGHRRRTTRRNGGKHDLLRLPRQTRPRDQGRSITRPRSRSDGDAEEARCKN